MYNDKGHLLKKEYEQVLTDGTVDTVENITYIVDKEDEHNNPLQVTDNKGHKKVYTYFYL